MCKAAREVSSEWVTFCCDSQQPPNNGLCLPEGLQGANHLEIAYSPKTSTVLTPLRMSCVHRRVRSRLFPPVNMHVYITIEIYLLQKYAFKYYINKYMNILHVSSSETLCVFVWDELIPLKMHIINAAKPIHGGGGCRRSPLYLPLSVLRIKNLKLYFSESPAEKGVRRWEWGVHHPLFTLGALTPGNTIQ